MQQYSQVNHTACNLFAAFARAIVCIVLAGFPAVSNIPEVSHTNAVLTQHPELTRVSVENGERIRSSSRLANKCALCSAISLDADLVVHSLSKPNEISKPLGAEKDVMFSPPSVISVPARHGLVEIAERQHAHRHRLHNAAHLRT